MARIRTIKPDAFLSESLSSVPRGTRWTFAGLWTYADDKGRGRDDARLVKAALYPLDDETSLADVRHDLDLLTGIGAICRYVVDGKNYLHMPKWEHQKINRPTPAKSPPCPIHEESGATQGVESEDSLNPHGVLSEPPANGNECGQVDTHGVLSESSTWEREVEKEGEGERKGIGSAVALSDDHEPTAQSFVAEWIEHCPNRPPGRVIGQVAKELKAMLGEGVDPNRVRAGLAEWNNRGLHPSTLPSVVHEISTPQRRRGKQQETDDIFSRAAVRMGVIQGGQQ